MNKIWWIVLVVVIVVGAWLWSKNGSVLPTYQGGTPAYSPASMPKSSTGNSENETTINIQALISNGL